MSEQLKIAVIGAAKDVAFFQGFQAKMPSGPGAFPCFVFSRAVSTCFTVRRELFGNVHSELLGDHSLDGEALVCLTQTGNMCLSCLL